MENFLNNLSKSKKFIVAELGKGFIQTEEEKTTDQYLENAKKLIKAAQEAGADAVKFQTHTYKDEQLDIKITAPHFSGSDRYSWVKRNSDITTKEFWQSLKKYCDKIGIIFFSTPMSRGAAIILEDINVPLWKVGSGDILDFVMLDYIASTGKPIIMSTGMSTLEEIDKTVDFIKKRTEKLILLHCVSKYPCPPEELYVDTIPYLAERYGVPVGFSDHSLGHDAVLAAIGRGARVIEKHFTLDRNLWGSDHKVSMLPDEFKAMARAARAGQAPSKKFFGKGVKQLDSSESEFRPIFRKSLVAGQDIPKGTEISKEMIFAMRPQSLAGGIPSERYEDVLGKCAVHDIKKYEILSEKVISKK